MNTTTKAKTEQPSDEPRAELTRRDLFAIHAAAGLLSSGRHFDKDALAEEAYALADALLIASTKEPK